MCGIAGIWGSSDVSVVEEMLRVLAHRGPDDRGLVEDGRGVLGHQRLAIIDPVNGHQPLRCNRAPSRVLTANGEIYNAPALRRRLEPRHHYRTKSDSESILHLYAEAGLETAPRLDGMFAFGLCEPDGLYLARDPVGIKPLYYGHRGDDLVFASEIKALAGRATNIGEFPPGACYHSKIGLRSYYLVPKRDPLDHPLDVVLHRLRQTLEHAVAKRLMSDVPLGAFLSGGLDSSIVAAIARQHVEDLHTFSVGLPGSPDLEASRAVANHLRTKHHEYLLDPVEVEQKLPEILYHLESYDRDLVRSAVPCYFLSQLAAEHVKVVLTGEGADELFAGYRYYQSITDSQALHGELRRSVTALHNLNLQRVDRMTMAHGLEARVPFLDVDMIEVAQTIAPSLKLARADDGSLIEKWVLRMAFEDLLPARIVWRDKAQFDEGTGADELLAARLRGCEIDAGIPQSLPGPRPRTLEERHYRDLLADAFSDPEPVLANVARWTGSLFTRA